MKNIIILSFLAEYNVYLEQFKILREHYNKIINHFSLPMKFYGVRASENRESVIDDDEGIIWLKTDNISEYDTKLIYKVVDCFEVINNSGVEYDVIVKTNTSFLINLIFTNNVIQNSDGNVIASEEIFYYCQYFNHIARGNYMCLQKQHINCIIKHKPYIENYVNNLKQFFNENANLYLGDDILMAYMLTQDGLFDNITPLGQYSLTANGRFVGTNIVTNIDDCLKSVGVSIRNNKEARASVLYEDSELYQKCLDIILMKIFVNYIESRLIVKHPDYLTLGYK